MAVLKDLLVNGASRFIGDIFINKAQVTTLNVPTASGGTSYGPGTSGQVLKSNGSTLYWASDNNTDTKVTQTAVGNTYTNWRPLIFGSSNSATEGFTPSTVTDVTYTIDTLSVQPSTGTIRATTFKGNATSATNDSDGNAINTTYLKKSIGTTAGDMIYWSAASTPIRLGIGNNNQILAVDNGLPVWSSNLNLAGTLNVVGNTSLHNETTIDSATIGSLVTTGSASFTQIPTAPTATDNTNDTRLATTEFVHNAFRTNDAMVFKGVVNAASDLPATHLQGWTYKVGTAGTYAGQVCEIGDTIYCVTDGTVANNDHWIVVQNNIDILPIARGGTGATTAAAARKNLNLNNVTNDAQVPKSVGTTAGDMIYWSAANTPVRLAAGTNGQHLKINNGTPTWEDDLSLYAVCNTAADVAAKVVTSSSNFVLLNGSHVSIKFTHTNTADNPTLNINSTGAKPIKNYGDTNVGINIINSWCDGSVIDLIYDSTDDVWYRDYQPAIEKGGNIVSNVPVATFNSETAGTPINDLIIDINPAQDLHGYANPWPAGGGKNLYRGKAYFHDKTYSLATVTAGETYTISAKKPSSNTHQYNYAYLKSDDSWEAKGGLIIRTATSSSVTVTIPAGVVGINVYDTDATPSNDIQIQVELGNQATTFAPYSNICPISGWTRANIWVQPTHDTTANPTVTIDLDGTRYGGALDVTTGVLTVTHRGYVLDGVNNIPIYSVISRTNTTRFYTDCGKELSPVRLEQLDVTAAICDKLPSTSAIYSTDSIGLYVARNISPEVYEKTGIPIIVSVPAAAGSTPESVMTWLNTNPLQIVYRLETPVTYQLTPTEVTTLLGQNNLWCNTGNIKLLKYYDENAAVFHDEIYDYLKDYKIKQSAVDSGVAETNKWISRIQQDENGNITPTKGQLDTSGTWSGNAATATDAVVLNSSIRVATTGTFDTTNVSPTWRRVAYLQGSHTGRSFLVVLYSSYTSPHDHTSTFMIHCGYNEAMITCLGNSGSLYQFSQARLVRAAADTSDYYLDFYYCGNSQYYNDPVAKIISFDNTAITTYAFTAASDGTVDASCIFKSKAIVANSVYGAVWNDYAEYRQSDTEITPGYIVQDNDNGTMTLANARLIPGAQVVSDTFGFAIGETDESKTPIAVSGRALVYTYQDRYNYHAGMAVCSAPGGTVDIMTKEEIKEYPDCIIGIVSEIPEYETWGSGNVAVDGRIWIKVR